MKMFDKQRSAFAEWWPTPNSNWTVPYNVVQRHASQIIRYAGYKHQFHFRDET